MVATAVYSVTVMLWKETTFLLCTAMVVKECCLHDVFCDSGDTPSSLLCELNGHIMPCTSCFYGKWVQDVCAGQFGVSVYLVLCCLVGCCTWLSCCAGTQHMCLVVTSQAIGFPLARGRRVVPSGRLLSSHIRLTGSLTAGI